MELTDPLYGTVEFTGVAAELVEHPAVQRLQGIHQNGAVFLVNSDMDTSRFEHTVGVAALCQRFGASEREVIAALVHDVGHTAFSHVADHVFNRTDQTFHEDEVDRIVRDYALGEVLDAYGYAPHGIFAMDACPRLEQDLPDLCADRLDYQLRDLYKYGLIDRAFIERILTGITTEGGQLVATDRKTAHRLVDACLLLQRQVFFNKYHEAANLLMTDLIETALDRGVLTTDVLFETDARVLELLQTEAECAETLAAIGPDLDVARQGSDAEYTITRKRRTMDPLVADTGARISDLEPAVHRKIERFRENVPIEQGYSVTLSRE